MRLYTVEVNGKEQVAIELKEGLISLADLGIEVSDMNDLILKFADISLEIKEKIKVKSSAVALKNYKVLAPVPIPRQDIICLGVNYKEHIDETAEVVDFTKKVDAVYFSKRVNRSNNPNGIIPIYDFVDSLDYEVELGVILKKDVFKISVEDAKNYILGYTIINDVSARNIQLKHQQWYRGKSLDGYTPMGPCIVTADEIEDVYNLSIECFVNGEQRQSSNTACMITKIEEAISELSQGMTLKAGTIIATVALGGVIVNVYTHFFDTIPHKCERTVDLTGECMSKTNNYIEEFKKYCMQKGLLESNFMAFSNMNQYINTIVDAYSDYPVWTEAFNGNFKFDTAYSMMKVDFKSRINKTIGISTDNYESTILIEPPMTKKTGTLQYLTAVDFKSIPLFFHPAVSWIDKYEKFAYKKRQPYLDDKTWYIYIFTTRKKHQRQGYGKRLMHVVSSFAKDNGYRIVLETDRVENVAMYEGFGFTLMDASIYNNLNHYVMLWS